MIEQLVRLAEIWAETNGRSVARLSTLVANDGDLFARITQRGGRLTTETFEKFLRFFRDGDNWDGGVIPAAAADLLDNFENIATDAAASTVKADGDSSDGADAAAGEPARDAA